MVNDLDEVPVHEFPSLEGDQTGGSVSKTLGRKNLDSENADSKNTDSKNTDSKYIEPKMFDVKDPLLEKVDKNDAFKYAPGAINLVSLPEEITSENKCSHCVPSKCCTYVTHEIKSPRSIREFDALLWKLAHENIQLFKEEGSWYLLFNTICKNLLPTGACGIYETRPMICREHTNDFCEFDSPAEEGFELFFDSYEKLDAYCRKRFKKWDQRFDNPRL